MHKNKTTSALIAAFFLSGILHAFAVPRNYQYSGNVPREVRGEAERAGRGGVPFRTTQTTVRHNSSWTSYRTWRTIQDAINRTPSGRAVVLTAGTYRMSRSIRMKSGVALRGASRSSVILVDLRTSGNSSLINFGDFNGTKINNAGVERLTLQSNLGRPPTGYNTFNNHRNNNRNSLIRIAGNNNWVENVVLRNSADSPVGISGNDNTILNTIVDGCWNKGGGGRGYFVVSGQNNLIAGCTFKHIRHVVIQRRSSSRTLSSGNVFANNRFEVDINFHNGDGGRNLIADNQFPVPSFHRWGSLAYGVPGTHQPPGPNNFLIRNNPTTAKANDMPRGNNIISGRGTRKYNGALVRVR